MNEDLSVAQEIENKSGEGPNVDVPMAIKDKFNWGAFFLTWIWGCANKSYITFLSFATFIIAAIPFANLLYLPAQLGIRIWFGIKGNEWAWQNKKFESAEAFHSSQRAWAIGGTIWFCVTTIIGILFGIFALLAIIGLAAQN